MLSVMVMLWYSGYDSLLMFGAIFPITKFDIIINHLIVFTRIKKKKLESKQGNTL